MSSVSPRYLSLQPSYYIDLNEGHEQVYDHHHHHQVVHHHHTIPFSFSSLQPHSSSASSLSSSSSSSSPIYLNPVQDQVGFCYMGSHVQPYPYQQEVENLSSYESGSYDQTTLEISKRANNGLKFSICKKEDQKSFGGGYGGGDIGGGASEINGSSVKWMSSKMRLMKKMMKTEEDQKAEVDTGVANGLQVIGRSSNNGSNINENTGIRVCSDCNTTKTPLWRSGPRGPKSLCNACGIRQRKARRAMAAAAAAAAAGNSTMIPNNLPNPTIRAGNTNKKASSNNNNNIGAQKKRSKVFKHHNNPSQRKLCFEKFALSLSKKLSLPQVFPQEEKEAAILLMAISCGLVHG